jgi:hypothetical protein
MDLQHCKPDTTDVPWSDLKKKLASEGYVEVSDKIGQLKMLAPDGKMRLTDCANTETMFRINPL